MTTTSHAAGDPLLTLAVFGAFAIVTLAVVYRVSPRQTASTDAYYTAGGKFTGAQNGVALSGDWLSAASFLGITGAIAVDGYDGFLYSIGFLVAWLVALLLLAGFVRSVGRYTLGDVLAFRMRQRPVRQASSVATLVISVVYMIAQMAGAGGLIALLLDVHSDWGQAVVIAVVGAMMLAYVLLGGMKGTTWVQIIKATLLLVVVAGLSVFLLGKYGFNPSQLMDSAAQHSPLGPRLLQPGAKYHHQLDSVSLALALVLGISCLPHVVMRFYTVPNTREAQRSAVWLIVLMIVFYLATLVMGYGATAEVGATTIKNAPGGENSAALLLAYHVGGTVLLGLVAAVAFATILAVVAGLTLTASASFAHDLYASLRTNVAAEDEIRVARWTAVVLGLIAIGGGIAVKDENAAFLVSLALSIAASANLSTLLYTRFWRRFNTRGTLWSIYAGLISSVLLIAVSPVVSGSPSAILPGVDFAVFPLENPGLVSIPISFLAGMIGTLLGDREDPAGFEELEVRALAGITYDPA